MGGVKEWRIKPFQLSTKLKLKFELSLAIYKSFAGLPLSCFISNLADVPSRFGPHPKRNSVNMHNTKLQNIVPYTALDILHALNHLVD